jgi:hypothetical protein
VRVPDSVSGRTRVRIDDSNSTVSAVFRTRMTSWFVLTFVGTAPST